MTECNQYAAMGIDQSRAIATAAAQKLYETNRWKALAARDFGLSDSTVYSWFRDDGRPPFWFLAICEARSELELLRRYLVHGIPRQ